jgi:hypothetical protein
MPMTLSASGNMKESPRLGGGSFVFAGFGPASHWPLPGSLRDAVVGVNAWPPYHPSCSCTASAA